jgi:uncharacterized protein
MKFVLLTLALVLVARPAAAADVDTRLVDAAEKSDRKLIDDLLKLGVDVNAAQVDGMTALDWAAFHDDAELVKKLITAGADVKAANRYGVSPLSLACTNGNTAIVELLLTAGADPNTKLSGGETVLMTAARTGVLGPVDSLIAHGADVNAKERKGQTALMWAAAEGNVKAVEALLAAGADYRATLPSGYTPLFFAIREGKSEVVKALLKAGIDVNDTMHGTKRPTAKDPAAGTSPLVLAIENGHFDLAVTLLDAGADPNDQRTGYTPLHIMTWVRKPNLGDGDDGNPPPIGSGNLNSLQFVRALVSHGAEVNARLSRGPGGGKGALGRPGATPFLMAAFTADVPLMKTLIDLGADPLLANNEGCTPLLAAAGVGVNTAEETVGTEPEVLESLELLLKLGGDVNTVEKNGETAMHGAAYRNHPNVVQFLADHGAKIDIWNQLNKHKWTPLAIAEGHRFGNFKPDAETAAAIRQVMLAAGVTPPADSSYSVDAKSGY